MSEHHWNYYKNGFLGEELFENIIESQFKKLIKAGGISPKMKVMSPTRTKGKWIYLSAIPKFNEIYADGLREREEEKAQEQFAKNEKKQREKSKREQFKIETKLEKKQKQKSSLESRNHDNGILKRFQLALSGRRTGTRYAGFEFVAQLINGLIYLNILLFLLSVVYVHVISIYSFFKDENANWTTLVYPFLLDVVSLLSTILCVMVLIFIRNFLDWLIDVEDHLHHLRVKE